MINTDHNSPANRDESNPSGGTHLDSVEAVESFAQSYLTNDFPNPQRINCPPGPKLIAAARAACLPDDDLSRHLMSCSECFSDFRAIRREKAVKARGASLLQRAISAFAGLRVAAVAAASLVLLVTVAVIALRSQSKMQLGETAAPHEITSVTAFNRAPDSYVTNNNAGIGGVNTDKSSLPANRAVRQVASNMTEIELDNYHVSRGAGQQSNDNNKTIILARNRYNLLIGLPAGSANGRYHVSIEDEFGKTKVADDRSSADGKSLRVTLDVRHLISKKTYMLCVEHRSTDGEEEPPRCYEVRISDTTKSTQPR